MKSKILFILVALAGGMLFSSCSRERDEISSTSVIKVEKGEPNEFDKWLAKNYIEPYNIEFKYRLEDVETDLNYYLVPAKYEKSIQMAKLVRHLCLGAYDEVVGPEFMKENFPKMILLVGSGAYRNNGTVILGTAEGGLKITLYLINELDPTNIDKLNVYYFRTIHHEFGHILNQKRPYSVDFKMISSSYYIGDSWNELADSTALKMGFITPYSSKEANEDFVELIAQYVTHTSEQWKQLLEDAAKPYSDEEAKTQKELKEPGDVAITKKMEIVSAYLKDEWNVDIDKLRAVILRRSQEVKTLDLNTLN